jgi:hypothetical protein
MPLVKKGQAPTPGTVDQTDLKAMDFTCPRSEQKLTPSTPLNTLTTLTTLNTLIRNIQCIP